MMSLAERLKKKAELKAKKAKRLSGKVKTFAVRVPYRGYPPNNTEGDIAYRKKRIKTLIDRVATFAGLDFYEQMKNYIKEREEALLQRKKDIEAQWAKIEAYNLTIREAEANGTNTTANITIGAVEPAIPPATPAEPPPATPNQITAV